MAKTPLALTIAGTGIRQDDHGRYSLNDLHKAAGARRVHQPANWLRLEQTQALIREMENCSELSSFDGDHSSDLRSDNQVSDLRTESPVSVINGGKNRGTYVPWEMVYAYAMWISPAFHLNVIRTFHAVATGRMNRLFVLPLEQDEPMRKALKLKDQVTLMEQGRAIHRELAKAADPVQRRGLWVQLVRVNNMLGIQTESMEAMGIEAPRLEGGAA